MTSHQYAFAVGIGWMRKVQVSANNLDEAFRAASEKLDVIAEETDTEGPVAWDLSLLEVDGLAEPLSRSARAHLSSYPPTWARTNREMAALGNPDHDAWAEPRHPFLDDDADAGRRARYWEWSNDAVVHDPVPALGVPVPGVTWHRVSTAAQADFEAFHMQHSVGYNFDHYSRMGEIHSLRRDGIPFVTALVAGTTVVHAVGPGNAMITDDDRIALQALCDMRGWSLPGNDVLHGYRSDDGAQEPGGSDLPTPG